MSRDTPPDPDRQRTKRFPDARSVHEAIRATPEAYPDGWVEQVRFRAEYDLPPFRPPRFADGTGVREAVGEIEAEHGIDVSFVRYGTSTTEWTVEIGDEKAFSVLRYRDDASNVVVETAAREFRERVERHLKRDGP